MKFYNANKNERQQASLLLHPRSPEEASDNSTTELFEAVVDDDAILHQDQDAAWKHLHIVAAQSGLVMSSLALMSTIGLDYLLFVLNSSSTIPQQQPKVNVLFFAAISCVINLFLAIFTLSILHDLSRHAYSKHAHHQQQQPQARPTALTVSKNSRTDHGGLQESLYDVDISYILGAVTGTSLLWLLMDLFMGLQHQVVFPITCLVLTFVSFRLLHHHNNNNNNNNGGGGVSQSRKLSVLDEEDDNDSAAYYVLPDHASSESNNGSFPVTVV